MKNAIAILLLAVAPAWGATKPAPASRAALSQQEQNKAIAQRVFDEILNHGKYQVADEIYAGDFVNHGTHHDADLAADQAAVRFERQACPDLTFAAGPMIAEGDLVSVLWYARGTHSARVGWLPATGAKIEVRGITIWRIADGKIREEWTTFDQMTVARKIASQLRWELLGLLFAVLLLLWISNWLLGKLFIRRQTNGRAWDSRE
jgi:predicted ester cyclase